MSAGGSGDSSSPLALLGQAMGAVVAIEEQLSTSLNAVAKVLPSFPAVRIMDIDIGLPHAHDHPPNLIPPAPPVPLPSVGPIIPIPILSGANQTLINGLPAARCGDMGLGIWCGGFVPLYEVYLGSSNVWIEGARAARVGVDITKHCVFSSPKPSDPPMGPMVGFTITCSGNVLIGGVPMPSLTALALAEAFKALGKLLRAGMRAAQDLGERLGLRIKPGFLKCDILKAEPVDITTGENVIEQQDFELPWPLPITWTRRYGSRSTRMGHCGYGWETPADSRLLVERDGAVLFYDGSAGNTFFPSLPHRGPVRELLDGGVLHRAGGHLQVRVKSGVTYHFGPLNDGTTEYLVERITDPCGNSLTFRREAGALREIISNFGPRLEVVSQEGRVHKLILHHPLEDKPRTLVRYEYSKEGDLREVYDALQNPYRFFYRNHCLIRHTNRNGLSFYYEFDHYTQEGRVLHTWGDRGLYNYHFNYDTDASMVSITNSQGHAAIVELNEMGLPIAETDPLGGVTRFEYDEAGRTVAVTDPAGHRTEYHYDDFGNLLKLTRPDGESIAIEFDDANHPVKITDPSGAVWQQEWDARGLLTRIISPLGAESRYEYDTSGKLIGFVYPNHTRTTLRFDAAGNLSRFTDALGHSTEFAYDALGNVIAKTDPLGHRSRYDYDPKGRLTKAVLPSGAAIACGYDGEDNLVRYVDEKGGETRLEYFGLGEIKRRVLPDDHAVEYHYDTEERLIGVTNQRGERYTLRRDALGRIVEEIDYWGQAQRYTYSAAGHLKESTDPLGRTIRYETDALGRTVKKVLPDPYKPDSFQVETFVYDPNGNLTATANDHVQLERKFNAEGRLVEERQGTTYVVTNGYDANGNRILRTTKTQVCGQVHSNTVRYTYDALDQAIAVEVERHDPVQLMRNGLGQVVGEALSSSLQRRFEYSPDGYLTAQRVVAEERPVLEQTFRHDGAGNLVERHDSVFGIEQYHYDPIGRLVAHFDPHGRLRQYLNDPAGDRLRTHVRSNATESPGGTDWWRYGEYDGVSCRFDRAGNLTERRGSEHVTRFTWDANQRLIQSTTNGQTTTYHYDPLGRRMRKQTGNSTTHFCWDADALLGDATVMHGQETGATPGLVREWVYYPGTFEPLALAQRHGTEPTEAGTPPDLYLYHNDPNGCPTRLLDGTQHVVWAAQYSALGKVERIQVNRVDNPIRLQGQYEDGETRLSYNRYRYYDADTGQFISLDPIGLEGGTQLYTPTPNILGWIDPLGLRCGLPKDLKTQFNKILDRAKTPGASGIRAALDRRELRILGEAFVGAGFTLKRGTRHGEEWLISEDGLRMYREPTPKSSDYARTGKQANFHQRTNVNQNWWDESKVSNVHVHSH